MGPSHRRVGSKRSASKNSGFLPWHCLSPERREAKKRLPQRRSSKRKPRRGPAEESAAPDGRAAPSRRRYAGLSCGAIAAAFLGILLWRFGVADALRTRTRAATKGAPGRVGLAPRCAASVVR